MKKVSLIFIISTTCGTSTPNITLENKTEKVAHMSVTYLNGYTQLLSIYTPHFEQLAPTRSPEEILKRNYYPHTNKEFEIPPHESYILNCEPHDIKNISIRQQQTRITCDENYTYLQCREMLQESNTKFSTIQRIVIEPNDITIIPKRQRPHFSEQHTNTPLSTTEMRHIIKQNAQQINKRGRY